MSFFVLKLMFAAMAIWLLITIALVVRHLRRKRQGDGPTPSRKAPKPAKEPRRKKAEAVEAEPEEAPVLTRRRQLATFAEDERSAAQVEAEALGLPLADAPAAEPEAAEAEPEVVAAAALPETQAVEEVVPEEVVAEAEEAAAEAEPPQEFDQIVMDRLEVAFEALQAREMSLDDYRRQVLAEEDAVERHIARAQESGDEFELEAGLAARESVRWCLNWAQEQSRLQ